MSAKQKKKSRKSNRKKSPKLPVKVVQAVPPKVKKKTPKREVTGVTIFERHDFVQPTPEPEIMIDKVEEVKALTAGQLDNAEFLEGSTQQTVVEKLENINDDDAVSTRREKEITGKDWRVVRTIASIILVLAVLVFGFAIGRILGQVFWDHGQADARSIEVERVSDDRQRGEEAQEPEEEPEFAPIIMIAEQAMAKAQELKAQRAQALIEQNRGKKLIALTFDDGPSRATTPRLLQILREKNVKATFFVVGSMLSGAPELVRQELSEGHEVGSHTVGHANLSIMDAATVRSEMAQMNQLYLDTIGKKLTILRPPYGAISTTTRENVGMPMVIWTVDTLDWKNRNAAAVRQAAVSASFDGAIILMHDIHPTTVDAVAGIIDDLRAQGYEFMTVSEMAAARGVTLQAGNVYGSFR